MPVGEGGQAKEEPQRRVESLGIMDPQSEKAFILFKINTLYRNNYKSKYLSCHQLYIEHTKTFVGAQLEKYLQMRQIDCDA